MDPATNSRLEPVAALARDAGLDGWLFYDFRGQNPLALTVLGIPADVHLTRRWFLYVPAAGEPTLSHPRLEGGNWSRLFRGEPLRRVPYSAHGELDARLRDLLGGARRVAMEYSPRGAVPFASRVDAGTVERVRETGVEIVSSADLLGRFIAWDDEDRRAHARAVQGVIRAKDEAFVFIHNRLRTGEPVTELDAQAVVLKSLREDGLVYDHPAIVAFGPHAGDPHFSPEPSSNLTLTPGTAVLIDLWAAEPGRPYADVTWVGHAGEPGARYLEVWAAVRDARDAALATLRERYRPAAGAALEGWEVDRVARDLLEARGFGDAFTHRLGHHIGREAVHGPGVNLDDLETHDTRRLAPGLGVTVEPGVYLAEFGVRSEVNVYLDEDGAVVTTPSQEGPYVLGGDVFHEHLGTRGTSG